MIQSQIYRSGHLRGYQTGLTDFPTHLISGAQSSRNRKSSDEWSVWRPVGLFVYDSVILVALNCDVTLIRAA